MNEEEYTIEEKESGIISALLPDALLISQIDMYETFPDILCVENFLEKCEDYS